MSISTFTVVDDTTVQLELESDSLGHEGTYSAVVTVGLADWSSIATVSSASFDVVIGACDATIVVPTAPASTTYTVHDAAETVPINTFSYTPTGCDYTFTYTA